MPGSTAPRYRNVLLMIADDWSPLGGCWGVPEVQTPNVDALAARGTRFTNAFCVTPSCAASRATILTGHYPQTNGQYGHTHGHHTFRTLPDMPSLPKQLGEAGFATACIGKLHVYPPEVYPWETEASPAGGLSNVQGLAELAGQFLDQHRDQPFYLHVGFGDPHRNFGNHRSYPGVREVVYDPDTLPVPEFLPDHHAVRAELAQYYQAISRLDQGFGMVLDALRAAGRADDTLVLCLSDHGMPFPGAKASCYDSGHRCPLIIARPGQSQPVVNDALVNWCNLAPTIYDWCGVSAPDGLPERSLLPILDESHPAGWDEVYTSHCFHEVHMHWPYRVLRGRRFKYVRVLYPEVPMPLPSDLWRSATWGAVLDEGLDLGLRSTDKVLHHQPEELYDLQTDPLETTNVSDDPALAGVVAGMRAKVKEFRVRTGDPWCLASSQRGEDGLGQPRVR